jgi:hypothetical protein
MKRFTESILVKVPAGWKAFLQHKAQEHNVSVPELIRRMISAWYKKQSKSSK